MPNTIGKFDYEVTRMNKDDRSPFSPVLKLCLKEYGATTRDGAPTVSADLMTEQEIADYVQSLKDDLDAVAAKAKRALKQAVNDTHKIVSTRQSV